MMMLAMMIMIMTINKTNLTKFWTKLKFLATKSTMMTMMTMLLLSLVPSWYVDNAMAVQHVKRQPTAWPAVNSVGIFPLKTHKIIMMRDYNRMIGSFISPPAIIVIYDCVGNIHGFHPSVTIRKKELMSVDVNHGIIEVL
jgi:hypothetical protein